MVFLMFNYFTLLLLAKDLFYSTVIQHKFEYRLWFGDALMFSIFLLHQAFFNKWLQFGVRGFFIAVSLLQKCTRSVFRPSSDNVATSALNNISIKLENQWWTAEIQSLHVLLIPWCRWAEKSSFLPLSGYRLADSGWRNRLHGPIIFFQRPRCTSFMWVELV